MTFGRQASGDRVLDGRLPSSIAVDRFLLTSCGIATLWYAAATPTSRAYLAANSAAEGGAGKVDRLPNGTDGVYTLSWRNLKPAIVNSVN
jgi:hypothetical protein